MKHRITVLGAGYAGVTAAGRLAKRLDPADVEITLVNAEAEFVERVRMHQLATGQRLKRRPLAGMLAGSGASVRVARVTAVDLERRRVELADGQSADGEPADGEPAAGESADGELEYDSLVWALGSVGDDRGVPGVAEHAHRLAGRAGALRLGERLAALASGQTVLVVGGGLTGIETAAEIAESRPDLRVVLAGREGVGSWLSGKARRHLAVVLDRLGVDVREGTDVARVEAGGAVLDPGGSIEAGAVVWSAGFAANPLAATSGLRVSAGGRIVVDGTQRSVSHPEVYAVGDAALAVGKGGAPLRMACATSMPMAWRAADALAARLTGRTAPEPEIGYSLQCVSLGRRDGIVQRVTPEDRPTDTVLTGRTAARVKELICSGAAWGAGHPTMLVPARRRGLVVDGAVPRPVTA
ncbi:oxidoreductase [Mangrovactinospora gilvigrisea]|uniref:Oxidoreductase n=1 Tax=Mangrovactinospora gilvigrisea TaxID=1428644 RepID=A0A1J7C7L1_9ACTN|nr:FAD-dependent oxidoreductase [Mangrovactinospora gilvigrisea]OIV35634.1 oxidoreductase [Mangrovactinospora gilvigrisea]